MKKTIFEMIVNGISLILFIIGIRFEMISWLHGLYIIVFIIPAIVIFLSKRMFYNKHRFTSNLYYYLACLTLPFTLSLIGTFFIAVIFQYPDVFNKVVSPSYLILYAIPSIIVLLLSVIYNKYISK